MLQKEKDYKTFHNIDDFIRNAKLMNLDIPVSLQEEFEEETITEQEFIDKVLDSQEDRNFYCIRYNSNEDTTEENTSPAIIIIETEPMKVELDIRGGVIDGVQTTPENISIYVRDYDVEGSEDDIKKDEDGDEYILKEF